MNKALAISLLVIGNLAAVLALSLINIWVLVLTFSVTTVVLIGLAAVAALGFASSRLIYVFERKYSLKIRWFFLAAYVSPIIGTAIYWIVYMIQNATGQFSGWGEGLGESFYGIFLSVTAAAYLLSGATWVSTVIDIKTRG